MDDLRDTLSLIESRLRNELYDLKIMIQELLPRNYQPPAQTYYDRDYYNQNYERKENRHQMSPPPKRNYNENNLQQTYHEPSNSYKTFTTTKPVISTTANLMEATKQPEVVNAIKPMLKSLESSKVKSLKKSASIITTPATETTTPQPIAPIPMKNEYTYYWKLENFSNVFKHAKKNEKFSHVFNVKGLFLRIRAMLQHLDDENLILDIEHLANIENADKMEIEISDGLVFKEIAEEKLFQYSFAIMDLNKPNHDLISPIYWNTDTDNFLVPNSAFLLSNYVKNDSLLIKLIISF